MQSLTVDYEEFMIQPFKEWGCEWEDSSPVWSGDVAKLPEFMKLVQNELAAYTFGSKDGVYTMSNGPDYDEWIKWVNDPVEFTEWVSNRGSNGRTRNPRQILIDGEQYQLKGAFCTYPRPLIYKNGEKVGWVEDYMVCFFGSHRKYSKH
jgi:hypothetical protein